MTDLRFLRHVRALTLTLWVPVLGLGADVARPNLRDTFAQGFIIGVALNTAQVDGRERRAGEIAAEQFSAVTPENGMKWQSLHAQPDRYDFKAADAYVEFSGKHSMALIGHALVSQDAGWYSVGEPNGGKFRPFDTLFTSFIPALRKRGFTREDIKALLVRNPAKAFSIARA